MRLSVKIMVASSLEVYDVIGMWSGRVWDSIGASSGILVLWDDFLLGQLMLFVGNSPSRWFLTFLI